MHKIAARSGAVLPCGVNKYGTLLYCTGSLEKAQREMLALSITYKGTDYEKIGHYAKKLGARKARLVSDRYKRHSSIQENLKIARQMGLEYKDTTIICVGTKEVTK